MQTTTSKNLPKRTRYYQGMIDLNLIEKGSDYSDLKKSYIIFICMQNPFKQNDLHLYTFENRCNENVELLLGDESTKVILTPDGTADDVSPELSEFLKFLMGKGGNSSLVRKLNVAVDNAKNKEEWRLEYMTLLMRDREKYAEGLAEGKMLTLISLVNDGILSEEEAAKRMEISVDSFRTLLETHKGDKAEK